MDQDRTDLSHHDRWNISCLRAAPYTDGETRFAESARSGDLGYTWGTYAVGAQGAPGAERGFYTRVWTRTRAGVWRVALDVLQPQP